MKPKTKADGIHGSPFGSKGVVVPVTPDPLQNREIPTPAATTTLQQLEKTTASKKIGTAVLKHDTTTQKTRADDINRNHLGLWEPWNPGTSKQ